MRTPLRHFEQAGCRLTPRFLGLDGTGAERPNPAFAVHAREGHAVGYFADAVLAAELPARWA